MPKPARWPTTMGRFSVHPRLFNASPVWLHEAADWLGGVHPSPWAELWDRMVLVVQRITGRGRA